MRSLQNQMEASGGRAVTPRDIQEGKLPFSSCIIFGAGGRGRALLHALEQSGVRVEAFLENNRKACGGDVNGRPVVHFNSLADVPDLPVIIASGWQEDIAEQLELVGRFDYYLMRIHCYFIPEQIHANFATLEQVHQALADEQSQNIFASIVKAYQLGETGYLRSADYPCYWHPQVSPEAGDIIIDGGAHIGDTLMDFHEKVAFEHMHCFEPFPRSCARLSRLAEILGLKDKRASTVCKGLWSARSVQTLNIDAQSSHANRIGGSSGAGVDIETIDIDSYVQEQGLPRVDLIKLDVEGSELPALQGALETIKRFKPKLQVCIYHKPEDIWELPIFIRELVPEYRFYIGHHGARHVDSVLYACC